MFLIIDNTEDGTSTRSAAAVRYGASKVAFSFWLDNKFVQRKYEGAVLFCLEKLLVNLKLKLKDIKCLGVVVGEGRFTATRLAVTAANALAYSLKIPVVALPKNFDQAAALKLAKSARAGKYVAPIYSAEARID